jgi:Domain of unknown function (DUF4145)
MKKGIWKRRLQADHVPEYPCPSCPTGVLKKAKKEDFSTRRPKDPSFSDYEENPPAWPSRFSLFLTCTKCREIVVMGGTSIDVPEEMLDGSVEWFEYLEPEWMWPASPMIDVQRAPASVKSELEKSFGFYWGDAGVCASRMRTSLERLLDHFKIPISTTVTDNSGKKSRKRLDLSSRIDKFAKKIKSTEYSELLHALRVVGNVGTHGKKPVRRTEMLDAYKLYEFALEKLFEDKRESIKAIIKRLKKLK